jgi:23S rRNA (uridine2552-2'-O)-methyltransferase
LLYVSKLVGGGGSVVGVDLHRVSIALPANTEVLRGDILEWGEGPFPEGLGGRFDVVLSDMAPACTGHKFVDVQRSLTLCRAALSLSDRVLRSGGAFVCKVFQGPGVEAFNAEVKGRFARTARVRPKSIRKASKEVYIVALGKRSGEKGKMG